MDRFKVWKIIGELAKDLLSDIPTIEELCPNIKDEKELIYIKQDKRSTIAYDRIINNYERNFKNDIESTLFNKYESAIEKGKEISPAKLKKIIGSIKRPIKEKICARFETVQIKAKNTITFKKFIKDTEAEIGDKLIDATTAKNILCLSDYVISKRIENSKEIRCFSFKYGNNRPRRYFSKSDIENVAEKEKDMLSQRQAIKRIKDAEKEDRRIRQEKEFRAKFGYTD